MFLKVRRGLMNDPLKLFDVISSKQVGHDGHHKG
jgi:hypothetical protein